jgi:hypothetical protein
MVIFAPLLFSMILFITLSFPFHHTFIFHEYFRTLINYNFLWQFSHSYLFHDPQQISAASHDRLSCWF